MSDLDTAATGKQSSPADYLRPIWRHRWLILLIVAVATVGTYVYYNRKPRVYAASTSLYIGSGSYIQTLLGETASSGDPTRTLTDLATLVDSPPVIAKAQKLMRDPAALGWVTAAPASNSDFIDLSSKGGSPEAAAATVNAYAQAFIDIRTQTLRQEAASGVSQIEHQIALSGANSPQGQSLQQELATLKTQEADPAGTIQQIAAAVPNPTPLSPDPKKDAIFAFALSLMVGIALAYGLDRMDKRIRTEEELEPIYRVPVLGEVPQVHAPTPDDGGVPYVDHEQWEAFRSLRTNLELVTARRPLRTVMVVSAQPSEGKSLLVRNLALAYADAGARVAIVEADLRAPTLSTTLGVSAEPGLTDVLAEAELLPEAIQPVPLPANDAARHVLDGIYAQRNQVELATGSPRWHASRPAVADEPEHRGSESNGSESNGSESNGSESNGSPSWGASLASVAVKAEAVAGTLDVLTCGGKAEQFSASVAAEGIKAVLARMTELYDIVLVDSAPLLAVSDSVPLVGEVDGVVVVARLGTTSQHAGRRVVELLARVPKARVLGVVANSLAKKPYQYGAYRAGYKP